MGPGLKDVSFCKVLVVQARHDGVHLSSQFVGIDGHSSIPLAHKPTSLFEPVNSRLHEKDHQKKIGWRAVKKDA